MSTWCHWSILYSSKILTVVLYSRLTDPRFWESGHLHNDPGRAPSALPSFFSASFPSPGRVASSPPSSSVAEYKSISRFAFLPPPPPSVELDRGRSIVALDNDDAAAHAHKALLALVRSFVRRRRKTALPASEGCLQKFLIHFQTFLSKFSFKGNCLTFELFHPSLVLTKEGRGG